MVFLNNDTEVVPGALEALVAQVAEPEWQSHGPRCCSPTGRSSTHGKVGFLRNARGT